MSQCSEKEKTFLWSHPVTVLTGVGPKKAQALQRLGIHTLQDLVVHFPREYRDLRTVKTIASVKDGEVALLCANIVSASGGYGYGRGRTLRFVAEDATGQVEILFFKSSYLRQILLPGTAHCFYGRIQRQEGRIHMLHPEHMEPGVRQGIEPVYPLTKGISQNELRKHIRSLLEQAESLPEELPASIVESKDMCSLAYALRNIHFPENETAYQAARYRLIYEELFLMQAGLFMSRDRFGKGREGIRFSTQHPMETFWRTMPYEPTGAQHRVLQEIEADMESSRAMNRLVQGDVGSGKTLIAQSAMYKAVRSGYQAAFMAPTELLAKQHFGTLVRDLKPLGLNVSLLTGSMKARERAGVLHDLATGAADIVVGTHAILSEGVEVKNLGLVITDEQHRFGVNQRLQLTEKGENPDVIVMTATPIPRTLAVVLYGDLEVSVIDELPPGRQRIETKRYDSSTRDAAYRLLERELARGRQAYVVAPLIEDSETVESRSAVSLYGEVCSRLPDYAAALLHGNQSAAEKERIMEEFYDGRCRLLVSTVVIEVGIDVPNATVMLIENAERFGLAQLHQLRGRVGRGSDHSYCLFVTDVREGIAAERSNVFCSTSDGFLIAEKDLALRGPGELFGFRQHGLPELTLADPLRHQSLFVEARRDAAALFELDPSLVHPDHRVFSRAVRRRLEAAERIVL